MDVFEVIAYLVVSLATTSAWSYLNGRAKRRFAKRETDYQPPYMLGAMTSILWPVQLVGLLVFAAMYIPGRLGQERAVALDDEMSMLRRQNNAMAKEAATIYRQIGSGADPSTKEGLLAISSGSVDRLHREADEQLLNLDKKGELE